MIGAEVFAILAEARALGFDLGQMASLLAIYFLLRKDLTKVIDKQFNKLIDALKSLENAHNERLNRIEAHVGLKNKEEK